MVVIDLRIKGMGIRVNKCHANVAKLSVVKHYIYCNSTRWNHLKT